MGLTQEERNSLHPFRRTFPPDTELFHEGDHSTETYILVHGEVEIRKMQKKIFSITQEGSFFGEMSTLLNEKRTASAYAIRETSCIVLPKSNFENTLINTPSIALKLLKTMATRLAITTSELVSVLEHSENSRETAKQAKSPVERMTMAEKILAEKKGIVQKSKITDTEESSLDKVMKKYPMENKIDILKVLISSKLVETCGNDFNAVQTEMTKLHKDIRVAYLEYSNSGRDTIMQIAEQYSVKEQYIEKIMENYKLATLGISKKS